MSNPDTAVIGAAIRGIRKREANDAHVVSTRPIYFLLVK
jgi:hypothetical protein